ncbi:MAG: CrcB family protein [Planctomycetota bacterium]|nr:CrcB family protein [Planctomycetota bacterium]MDA1247942.1 CrcB family protein [Planctomycetota bacterium]
MARSTRVRRLARRSGSERINCPRNHSKSEKSLSDRARLIRITGCLGSLTTFSTFGFETISLIREDRPILGVANVAANVIVGLIAVLVGMSIARYFVRT